jgi:prophage regulatory protein
MEPGMESPTILRRKQVEERCGLSRSAIYASMARDDFPRPVRIGRRAVGWYLSDINLWLNSRQRVGRHL